MYVTTTEGKGGEFWWQIREKTSLGNERTVAVSSTPGFQTEAEAREEGERVLRRPHGFQYHFWPVLLAAFGILPTIYVIYDLIWGVN